MLSVLLRTSHMDIKSVALQRGKSVWIEYMLYLLLRTSHKDIKSVALPWEEVSLD